MLQPSPANQRSRYKGLGWMGWGAHPGKNGGFDRFIMFYPSKIWDLHWLKISGTNDLINKSGCTAF